MMAREFGTWPGAYEHCWGSGKYMEALFTAIERTDGSKAKHLPGFMRHYPALGLNLLPTASYMEMG